MSDPTDGNWSRPFVEIADTLIGRPSDQHRHAIARTAFMRVLLDDARVIAVFEEWGRQTGLTEAATAVGKAGDTVAAATGMTSRAALFEPTYQAPRERETAAPFAQFAERLGRYHERIDCATKVRLVNPTPHHLVQRTLGLPWPWVAIELVDSFYRSVHAIATGRVIVRRLWAEPTYPRAPAQGFVFAPSADEPARNARRRFERESAEYRQALLGVERSEADGRFRKGCEQIVRDAQWFYRARVKHPADSIRVLAQAYHASTHGDRAVSGRTDSRSVVQNGIKRAERLLDLVNCVYTPVPK